MAQKTNIIFFNSKNHCSQQTLLTANFSTISREHLKIIYKENLDERNGFYIIDLGKLPSSFVIEDKPYILAKNTVIIL